MRLPGDRRRRDEQEFPPLLGVEFVATVGVGRGRTPLDKPGRIHPLLANKCLHRRPGDGLARGDVDDVPGQRMALHGLRLALRRHDRQSRHPPERGMNHVVVVTEAGIVAGDHPVRPRFERLWLEHRDGHVVVPRPVLGGGRQVDGRCLHRRQRENGRAVGVVEPRRVWLARLEPRWPVGLGKPQVHLREVAVGDANHGPGGSPGPLGGEREFLRVDLLDEIPAELAADAGRVFLHHPCGDRPGLHEIVVLAGDLGERVSGLRRDLVVTGPPEEAFDRVSLPVGHGHVACIDGGASGPKDPIEVGREEGGAVGIGRMEVEQRAVERGRLEDRRIGVGDARVVARRPGPELVWAPERRARRREFEGVFGVGEAAFTRRGKRDRVVDDDIPHGRPVGVGHGALGEQRLPLADREFLEGPAAIHRGGESLPDLADDRGQIPLADPCELAGLGPACGPLLKPPAVQLKIAPGPVGPNRLEHRPRLGGRRLDRGCESHEPLRILRRTVTRSGEHAGGDRPGHFIPCLVGHGRLLDARERLGSRLRLPVGDRLLDPLPGLSPRTGGEFLGVGTSLVHEENSQDGHDEEDPVTHARCGPQPAQRSAVGCCIHQSPSRS